MLLTTQRPIHELGSRIRQHLSLSLSLSRARALSFSLYVLLTTQRPTHELKSRTQVTNMPTTLSLFRARSLLRCAPGNAAYPIHEHVLFQDVCVCVCARARVCVCAYVCVRACVTMQKALPGRPPGVGCAVQQPLHPAPDRYLQLQYWRCWSCSRAHPLDAVYSQGEAIHVPARHTHVCTVRGRVCIQ